MGLLEKWSRNHFKGFKSAPNLERVTHKAERSGWMELRLLWKLGMEFEYGGKVRFILLESWTWRKFSGYLQRFFAHPAEDFDLEQHSHQLTRKNILRRWPVYKHLQNILDCNRTLLGGVMYRWPFVSSGKCVLGAHVLVVRVPTRRIMKVWTNFTYMLMKSLGSKVIGC